MLPRPKQTEPETRSDDLELQTTRRPYRSPVFENLGDIRDITMGGSQGVGESGGRRSKTGRGS